MEVGVKGEVIVGIDTGIKGAVAIYNTVTKYLEVHDMPVRKRGKLKLVDARKSFDLMRYADTQCGSRVTFIALEVVTAMPTDGVVSAFNFGHRAGMIEAAALSGCPTAKLLPLRAAVWKGFMGLTKSKNASLELAREYFPNNLDDFKLKKHDGRAEAALLTIAAYKTIYE